MINYAAVPIYLLAFALFSLLLFRLLNRSQLSSRITTFFLIASAAILFSVRVMWLNPAASFLIALFILYASGTVLLLAEQLIYFLQSRADERRGLSELKKKRGMYYEIIEAARQLSEAKQGALILMQRKQDVRSWAEKGICIDAHVTKEIIYSIFTPPGALHDGACLIGKQKIAATAIIVPLTKKTTLSRELGTRHRAAIGFSEVCDALCLVVSEETGAISLSDRGTLYYDIPPEKLSECLAKGLKFKLEKSRIFRQELESLKV